MNTTKSLVAGTLIDVQGEAKRYGLRIRDGNGQYLQVMYARAHDVHDHILKWSSPYGIRINPGCIQNFPYLLPGSMILGICTKKRDSPTLFINDVHVCPPDAFTVSEQAAIAWIHEFEQKSGISFSHLDITASEFVTEMKNRQEQGQHLLNFIGEHFFLDAPDPAAHTLKGYISMYDALYRVVRLGHDVTAAAQRKKQLSIFSISNLMFISQYVHLDVSDIPEQAYTDYMACREEESQKTMCVDLIPENSLAACLCRLILLLYDTGMESYVLFKAIATLETFLKDNNGGGHTCMPMHELYNARIFPAMLNRDKNVPATYRARFEEKIHNDADWFRKHLARYPQFFHLVKMKGTTWVYLTYVWEKECFVKDFLREKMDQARHITVFDIDSQESAEKEVHRFAQMHGIDLTTQQKSALIEMMGMAVSPNPGGLFCLTGLPGTGKSYVISLFERLCQRRGGISVFKCAPSGKAACRTSGVTVHRLVRELGENSAREGKHVVILDEVSMVDIQLAYYFFRACREKSKNVYLICVGDPHQLPPIGHGNVLGALLKAGPDLIPQHFLSEIKRQSHSDSLITKLAHYIIDDTKSMQAFYDAYMSTGTSSDVELCLLSQRATPTDTVRVRETYTRLRELYARHKTDCIILTPKKEKQDALGTYAINRYIHGKFYADSFGDAYTENERVFVTKNTHDAYNGELGVFEGYCFTDDDDREQVIVRLDDEKQCCLDKKAVDYGHACTVHRMQGSDHPVVILVLDRSHEPMLTKSLLYTAVTRAKNKLIIVGDKETFLRCPIRQNDTGARVELLSHRLCAGRPGVSPATLVRRPSEIVNARPPGSTIPPSEKVESKVVSMRTEDDLWRTLRFDDDIS